MNLSSLPAYGLTDEAFWECFNKELANYIPIEKEYINSNLPSNKIENPHSLQVSTVDSYGKITVYWNKMAIANDYKNFQCFDYTCTYIIAGDILALRTTGAILRLIRKKKISLVDRIVASL
jgi:hypothetical protein